MRSSLKKLLMRWHVLFAVVRIAEIYLGALYGRVHDPEYKRFKRHVSVTKRPVRILDVGANLGQSMVTFSSLFPDLCIDCIEPNPKCFKALDRVALLLKFKRPKSKVRVFRGALWPENKAADPFYVPVTDDGLEFLQEGSFDKQMFSLPETIRRIGVNFALRKIATPVIHPKDLLAAYDVIKIDVQGTELVVIELLAQHGLLKETVLIVENDFRFFSDLHRKMTSLGFCCDQQWENSLFYKHASMS